MRKAYLSLSLVMIVLVLSGTSRQAQAQGDPNFQTALAPFAAYHGGDIDSVDLSNQALSVDIPLASYPQRGDKLGLEFDLHYINAGSWTAYVLIYSDPETGEYDYGWDGPPNLNHGFQLIVKNDPNALVPGPGTQNGNYSWGSNYLQMSDGPTHQLAPSATSYWESVDATGFKVLVNNPFSSSNSIIDPDGIRYTGSLYNEIPGPSNGPSVMSNFRTPVTPTIEDPNGNKITFSTTSGWLDSLGRTIPVPVTSDTSNCPTTPATPTSAWLWSPPTAGGGSYSIKFCFVQISETNPIGYNDTPYTYNELNLQSVVFINDTATQTTWNFSYTTDGNNDLSQVTFPTGGTISYAWTLGTPLTAGIYFLRAVQSRTLNPNDGVTAAATWNYSMSVTSYNPLAVVTTVTDPASNYTVHTLNSLYINAPNGNASPIAYSDSIYETQVKYYQSGGTLLKTVGTTYSASNPDALSFGPEALNVVPTAVTTAWANGQTSQISYTYDSNTNLRDPYYSYTTLIGSAFASTYGKVLTESDYDYGSGSYGSLLKTTTNTYLPFSNSTYLTNNLINLLSSTQIKDGGGVQRTYTVFNYDQYTLASSGVTTQRDSAPPDGTARGNQTSVSRWLSGSTTATTNCNISVSNGNLTSYKTYNDTGTVATSVDSCGTSNSDINHRTTYSYSATYAGAFRTQVQLPTTGGVSHITSTAYDLNTGLITSATDQNGKTTTYSYDTMGRPALTSYPDLGQTTFSYTLGFHGEYVGITEKMNGSGQNRVSYVWADGLGREGRIAVSNGESSPWDEKEAICYDGLGQVKLRAYPYQDGGWGGTWSCSLAGDSFAYDGLGRTTSVTHSDSSQVQTAYTGRATSGVDEGNGTQPVQRISQIDGLGRLTSVCEVTTTTLVGVTGSTTPAACGQDIGGTGFLTTYGYDALDNLTSVSQSGLNPRSFVYDSLSRMTSSTNPEAGSTSYTYDADANILKKTDARGTVICYGVWSGSTCGGSVTYDALNRLLTKSYSDGTPTVTYGYDQSSAMGISLSNTIGRKSSESTSGTYPTGSVFGYDTMGRVTNNSQCTPQNCSGAPFSAIYSYDLVGDVLTSTNGAGVTFTAAYNAGGRLVSLTSSLSDANHPGTLFGSTNIAHYNAAGSLTSVTFGNGVNETRYYDGRLRICLIQDGSAYSVGIPSTPSPCPTGAPGYAANSDVIAANDTVNGNWTYGYDPFNRLIASNQNSGTNTFVYGYDRFGNRWSQTATHGGGPQPSYSFDANNHITGTTGITYDLAGDMNHDPSHAYSFDAEGRISQVDSGTAASYVYDAEGRRVRKATASGAVEFVYDLNGREISQFTSTGTWTRGEVYATSRHVAIYQNSSPMTWFVYSDWLGTERYRQPYTTGTNETCTNLPFGDALSCSGTDPSPMHYTGKEHDTETGLEDFGARYDSSSIGRFMTADWARFSTASVPYADFGNPQTLNLYNFVRDNPMSVSDLDGHRHCDADRSYTDPNGAVHVIAGACHSDWTDSLFFGVGAFLGVGHHYIPSQIFSKWDPGSLAHQLAQRFTSGPLVDKSKNYYDALHRAYNSQTAKIIEDYLEKTGKNAEELTKEDFKAIVEEMKAAGGAIEEFNNRLASDVSEELRNIDEGLQTAIDWVEENGGELIQACEHGAPCGPE